jgi:hypothetical protein
MHGPTRERNDAKPHAVRWCAGRHVAGVPGDGANGDAGGMAHVRERTMWMFRRCLTAAASLVAAALFAGSAQAFDLNGAWATDRSLCDKIFQKQGKELALTPLSDFYGGGFIIEGNRVRGKIVRCRIDSRKEDGPIIQLNVACTTEIATEQIQFDLKVVNDNTVAKTFPGTDVAMDYHRCTL